MHRIWVGLDPHIVLGGLGSFLAVLALVIHIFAFNTVNYPGQTIERYASPAAVGR